MKLVFLKSSRYEYRSTPPPEGSTGWSPPSADRKSWRRMKGSGGGRSTGEQPPGKAASHSDNLRDLSDAELKARIQYHTSVLIRFKEERRQRRQRRKPSERRETPTNASNASTQEYRRQISHHRDQARAIWQEHLNHVLSTPSLMRQKARRRSEKGRAAEAAHRTHMKAAMAAVEALRGDRRVVKRHLRQIMRDHGLGAPSSTMSRDSMIDVMLQQLRREQASRSEALSYGLGRPM